jgi:histidinol dehydrogenase
MMRILKLTPSNEKRLFAARERQDALAARTAARIVTDVRRHGDASLRAWTKKLDRVDLKRAGIWVSRREIRAARKSVSADFLRAIQQAARNVRRVAERQLPRPWSMQTERGVTIAQTVRAISSVGCYVPGGRFALVSTLVMTAVPAQVAGTERIIVVCPRPSPELLAAADLLGICEIARIGGAQAIAALAYGTETVPRVEKICGPGNRFVTAAKQIVSSDCAIDLPAGPTEAVVLASRGNAEWIAADLLAQAEHAPDAGSYLVTDSLKFAKQVQAEVEAQLRALPAENPANLSIRRTGAILLVPSLAAGCDFVNRFAPEHLSVPDASPAILRRIDSSGTIFAGPLAAQPLGDYVSGSNHVLPTGGWARRRGGLSSADFVKCITVQTVTKSGFAALAPGALALAEAEGLRAHARAVEVRQ